MSIQLHPKHGVAPMLEICKLSGYSTGRIVLMGQKCHKYLDKNGDLPRYIVTGEIHPKIHEILKQGGVCVTGPNQFDCVVMNENGAKSLFKNNVHGHVMRLGKEAWDHFLTLLPQQPKSVNGSHVGEEFPSLGNTKEPSTDEDIQTDTPTAEEEPSKEDT